MGFDANVSSECLIGEEVSGHSLVEERVEESNLLLFPGGE